MLNNIYKYLFIKTSLSFESGVFLFLEF